MIDLVRFTKEKEVIMPIIDGWGQSEGRKIQVNLPDDWYKVIMGSLVRIERKASPLEIAKVLKDKKLYKAYAIGEEAIPTNFDHMLRKGFSESIQVNFLNVPLFTIIKAALLEDKRFYYYDTTLSREQKTIRTIKERFDREGDLLGVSEITPEIRYYFLLANLQRQSYRAAVEFEQLKLSELERKRRIEEFNATFPGRLQSTVEKAGGALIKFTKYGKGYLVHWRVGDQIIKSTIRDDLRIVSAGFCLSGDDKKHTVASIVNLAKLFQQDKPLYITRE